MTGRYNFGNQVRSFDDLYIVLNEVEKVESPNGYFSAGELIKRINGVQEGKIQINRVTRTYGLRDKVSELLESGKVKGE